MIDHDPSRARWRKSSHSGSLQNECVECAWLPPHGTTVRDSKNADGPRLTLSAQAWGRFVTVTRDTYR